MKSAIFDNGIEMSHLMLPPVRVCASEISSRSSQKARVSAMLAAIAASVTRPRSMPCSRIDISVASRPSASPPEVSSISTIQSWALGSGALSCGMDSSTSVSAGPEINSKAVTAWPATRLASVSSSTAACGSFTAIQAAAVALGSGISLSTAAVMMPSVPSEPMNSCLRS